MYTDMKTTATRAATAGPRPYRAPNRMSVGLLVSSWPTTQSSEIHRQRLRDAVSGFFQLFLDTRE